MKKTDEGFTLIELLIVIVILGILAAVVVFAVGGITDSGQESSCKAELKTLETAIEAYRAQNGTYATSITALTGGEFLRSDPTWYELGTGSGTAHTTEGATVCSAVPPS
jgi:type II secretion system protein G